MHYLLPYHLYSAHRLELLKNIFALNLSLKHYFDEIFLNVLLFATCLEVYFQAWICISMFQDKQGYFEVHTFRKKCPNTEFFLVCIFTHSDQKKLRIWTLFTQCTITPWTFAEENEKCPLIYFSFELKHRAYIYLSNFVYPLFSCSFINAQL